MTREREGIGDLPRALETAGRSAGRSCPAASLRQGLIPILLLVGTRFHPAPAVEAPEDPSWWTKERKAVTLNLALDGALIGYGFAAWDWGTSSFSTTSEGWFASDTTYGGADKLGHAFTGYLVSDLAAWQYRRWGYDDAEAARWGACSSIAFTTLMEIGDGISAAHGFSYEDLIMNCIGAGFSWLRQEFRGVAQLIDFRTEYFPSEQIIDGQEFDITTDYEGMRHLLAFTCAGIPACQSTWLRFLEVQVGYYTRGYDDADEQDRRHLYAAVGLNVGEVAAALWRRTTFFDYYQVPYTYIPFDHTLD